MTLVDRIRAATKHDPGLDAEIATALGLKPEHNQFYHNQRVRGGMEDDAHYVYEFPVGSRCMISLPRYTETEYGRNQAADMIGCLQDWISR